MSEKITAKEFAVIMVGICLIGLWIAFAVLITNYNDCVEDKHIILKNYPLEVGDRVIVCENGDCYSDYNDAYSEYKGEINEARVICHGKIEAIYALPEGEDSTDLMTDENGDIILLATCLCDDGDHINRPYTYFFAEDRE